uniref:Calponin-homology (CH) domain-containing protein n=1 Tax=Parastrongyloides trichosuri TaxID=131310 RepID=A0A0N4Z2G2_PARTI
MDDITFTECGIMSSTMNASCAQTPRTFFKETTIEPVPEGNETQLYVEEVEVSQKVDFIAPKLPNNYNKENDDFDTKRERCLKSLEKRNSARKKSSERFHLQRKSKERKIDVIETTKKFLGEDVSIKSSITISRMDMTVEYNGSILNSTELLSTTSCIETKEEAERRNSIALAAWINQLLGVDKNSCEDIESYSEKAKIKANEILKNTLKNQKAMTEVVYNLNNTTMGSTRRMMQWIETVNKAKNYIKNCNLVNSIRNVIESGNSNITVDDLKAYTDFGLQQELVEVLLSYNPMWLRLALECIFDVELNISDYSTCHNTFISFIVKNVFSCQKILKSKKYCPTGTRASATPVGVVKLQNYFIEKMLLIVTSIEYFQRINLITPENPPMFASHSSFQSSKNIITWIRRRLISRKFDLSKALTKYGLTYEYEQKFYDSYNYVVQDIKTDLCDGIILGKVLETIFKVSNHSLLSSLRAPGGDRLRKIGNVKNVLKFAKDNNIDIGNIKPEDIVQGKRQQIIELLWKIVGVFVSQKDQYQIFRRISKRLFNASKNLDNLCGIVPEYLDGFDIILHVTKQFCILMGMKPPSSIEDFLNGSILVCVYNNSYVKYGYGMPVSKFDGDTLMHKALNIAVDELEIPVGLFTMKSIAKKDWNIFELFVKTFMEKCFIVKEIEESACVIQRFFRKIVKTKGEPKVKELLNDNKMNDAAKKIQAVFRGYKVRKMYAEVCLNRNNAAVKIQKFFRGYKARKLYKELCLNENLKCNAATRIQKVFRGYQARRLYKELCLNKKLKYNAAIKIQKVFRGYRARKIYKENLKKITLIQRSWKQYRFRKIINEHIRNKKHLNVVEDCKELSTLTEEKENNQIIFNEKELMDEIDYFVKRASTILINKKL